MQKIRLGILGAGGKMGKMLQEAALKSPETFEIAALFEVDGSALLGKKIEPVNVAIQNFSALTVENLNCVIDFTRPEGTLKHLAICKEKKIPMVIGTTGFDDDGKAEIEKASAEIPIVFAPNMAVGVNVVFKLLKEAAKVLNTYDVEIVEAHHRLKVDSPSGTALKMGEIVADALGRNLKDCAIYGREGNLGVRDNQTIAFSTIRGGDIVGDHTVMFCGIGERVEITHKGGSRMPYAEGAMRAAVFLQGKAKGLFNMQDVLGLN